MELTEQNAINLLTAELQPKIRVDGGDVVFEKLAGTTIYLGAHAECAICPATAVCLHWWTEQAYQKAFGESCKVVITKHVPYFAR